MVKGEHLRPLLGFLIVCCTAALVLASGMQTPALRRLVTNPPMLSVPQPSDLVLGQTLDGATPATGSAASQPAPDQTGAGSGASAALRSALVLSSFRQPTTASSPVSVRIRTVSHAATPKHHAHKAHQAATPTSHPSTPTPSSGNGSPAPSTSGSGGTGSSSPGVVAAGDVKHHGLAVGHTKHQSSRQVSPGNAHHQGWGDTRVRHTHHETRISSEHTSTQGPHPGKSQDGAGSNGPRGHGSHGSSGSHGPRGHGNADGHGQHDHGHHGSNQRHGH